jgi:hypothetical protein
MIRTAAGAFRNFSNAMAASGALDVALIAPGKMFQDAYIDEGRERPVEHSCYSVGRLNVRVGSTTEELKVSITGPLFPRQEDAGPIPLGDIGRA